MNLMNHNSRELYHFGIPGMKWYQRRFQNEDGTLTAAGKERYKHRTESIEKNEARIKDAKNRESRTRKSLDELKKEGTKSSLIAKRRETYLNDLKNLNNDLKSGIIDLNEYRKYCSEVEANIKKTDKDLYDELVNEHKERIKKSKGLVNELTYENEYTKSLKITDESFLEYREKGQNILAGSITAGVLGGAALSVVMGPIGFMSFPMATLGGGFAGFSVGEKLSSGSLKKYEQLKEEYDKTLKK